MRAPIPSDPSGPVPVVLLASSRALGNTHALAAAVTGDRPVRYADLNALAIGYYAHDGKHADDAFLPLIRELVDAPLWILATPLYWYAISAQAKTFLDRLTDLLDDHKDLGRGLRGKAFAVVCSGTDASAPPHFTEPLKMTCDYLGMRFVGLHYAPFVDREPARASAFDDAAAFGAALWRTLDADPCAS